MLLKGKTSKSSEASSNTKDSDDNQQNWKTLSPRKYFSAENDRPFHFNTV